MPDLLDYSGLATLDQDGEVPSTRMKSALEAKQRIDQLVQSDDAERAFKRSLVKGLVDGNAPYRAADLTAAGRSDMCNVNWRIAEAYLAMALAIRYQMFSDTPTYAVVGTEFGKGVEQSDWGATMTEQFDKLQKSDRFFDYEVQCSQYDTVLYGLGPQMFRDTLDWRSRYIQAGMLYLPEFAKSKTEDWEESALRVYYTPHDLYSAIRYPAAATQSGWNVDAVKRAIISAYPRTRQGGKYTNWEYHQQQLKNSSFYYSSESKAIHVAHYFFREFPKEQEEMGRITHVMVDMNMEAKGQNNYLYRKEGRFGSWDEIIHPMYYDHGGGGYHHSVTGMGIKMFAAMTFQNRLLCNLADKSFAPKVMFRPTSATSAEEFQLVRFGDYAQLPSGFDVAQMPVNGYIQEGMEFNQLVSQVISSNLSQYRKEVETQGGNPRTATEINRMASEEATMSTADTNHAYNQYDWLYAEKFRRACNFNLTGKEPGSSAALKFQKACEKAGVPKQAMKLAHVTASRMAGSGNAFLRKQTLMRLMQIMQRLPESGQEKLLRDYIASEAGFTLVNRYMPERDKGLLPTDQEMLATLQVGNAHQGIPPVITDTENPVIYAQVFLQAAAGALQALQQAGPQALPATLSFLETIGPAIGKHLQRIKNDPTRVAVYKALEKEYAKMGSMTDQLHKKMQVIQQEEQQKAQMAQRAQTAESGMDPEFRLKAAAVNNDIHLKQLKTAADLKNKEAKSSLTLEAKSAQVRQNLAVTDLRTAQDIKHANIKTAEEIKRKRQKDASAKPNRD